MPFRRNNALSKKQCLFQEHNALSKKQCPFQGPMPFRRNNALSVPVKKHGSHTSPRCRLPPAHLLPRTGRPTRDRQDPPKVGLATSSHRYREDSDSMALVGRNCFAQPIGHAKRFAALHSTSSPAGPCKKLLEICAHQTLDGASKNWSASATHSECSQKEAAMIAEREAG